VSAPPELVVDGDLLSLHFEASQVQSRMARSAPDALVLAYTRVMMGFLLFVPAPARIAMIGLGGGALARACRRWLPDAYFTAIECSGEVIALRDALAVPPDGPRFRVVHADGADWVQGASPVDVLLVDGFDGDGQPPRLCSHGFYRACHAALRSGGVLVVNLNREHTRYDGFVGRIHAVFGERMVVVGTPDSANKLVFACKDGAFPPPAERLEARAGALPAEWELGAVVAAIRADRRLSRRFRPPGG
jgi:spermidine synthase